MKFLIYGFLFAVLILKIFACKLNFKLEKHGEKCQQGLDINCGFNCKCNQSNLCECVKPQNLRNVQFCYDNIPKVPYSVAMCRFLKHSRSLFCHFHCIEGPILKSWHYNRNNQTCRSQTESWFGYKPECYHNDCNDAIIINKGLVKCVNSTKNEKICNISCRKGLTLIGNDKMTCRKPVGKESGWTGKKPMCLNSRCLKLMVKNTIILNAESQNCTVRARDNYAICKVTCKKGYWIEGRGLIHCNSTGERDLPNCTNVRKRCKHLKDGEVTNNLTITNCSTALDGYQKYCGFKCNDLFAFPEHKRQRVVCKFSKGEWKFPKCIFQPYRCESLNVGGVKATCTLGARSIKNKPWSCDLECREGFRENQHYPFSFPTNVTLTTTNILEFMECGKQQRKRHLTCNYGNKWSAEPMQCLKKFNCTLPQQPFTSYNCSQKRPSEPFYCTLICDEGYHVSGSKTITCKENSKWDGRGSCYKDYECETQRAGRVPDCNPFQDFNSEWDCDFKCEEKKKPEKGAIGRNICQKNGKWKKTPLECK